MKLLTLEEYYAMGNSPVMSYTAPEAKSTIIDKDARIARLLVSTKNTNRRRHQLNPHGANLEAYRGNPVLMWNHAGYDDPTRVIGKTLSITQTDDGISAIVQYANLDSNPLPDLLWELECNGLLPANSIGIRPLADIREEAGLIHIGEFELIDISKVAVGEDPFATNRLLK